MSTTSRGPSRRTLVKGAAWSVPVVAMAQPAMAACASDPADCPPCLVASFSGDSCKCPGGGRNNFNYYVSVCFTNNCGTGDLTVAVTQITLNNGTVLWTGNQGTVPTPIPPGETYCTPEFVFDDAGSSPAKLRIYYSVNGRPVPGYAELFAPPKCADLEEPRPCPGDATGTTADQQVPAQTDAKLAPQPPSVDVVKPSTDVAAPTTTDDVSQTSAP